MGASSWHYFTPYRPDPEVALQELRRDVFARGDYSFGFGGFARPDGPPVDLPDLPSRFGALPRHVTQIFEAIAGLPGEQGRATRAAMTGDYTGLTAAERRDAELMRPMFTMGHGGGSDDEGDDGMHGFMPDRRPDSIEELLEVVGEDGTHSVLDVEHTGPRVGFAIAAPLSARRIAATFGDECPTREQVEENWDDLAGRLDRWQAYYLVVHKDGKPHEYAFIGCSGD